MYFGARDYQDVPFWDKVKGWTLVAATAVVAFLLFILFNTYIYNVFTSVWVCRS